MLFWLSLFLFFTETITKSKITSNFWERKWVYFSLWWYHLYLWPTGIKCYFNGECICHKNNSLQNSNFKLKEPLRYIIFLSLLSGIKQESRWILLQDDQQQNQGKETYIFLLFHFDFVTVQLLLSESFSQKSLNCWQERSGSFHLNLFCHIWSGF